MNTQIFMLAAVVVCLLLSFCALLATARAVRRERQLSLRQRALLEDLATLRALGERAAAGVDNAGRERLRLARQVLALQGDVDEVRARFAQPPGGSSSSLPDRVLDGAIRRVHDGAGADLLVREYGMSPVEAELLAKLHGGQRAAG